MSGSYYSSPADAEFAFQSKNMFNKTITLDEDNPSEVVLDYTTELYKVFMMAHYYMWDEFGTFRIIPLSSNPIVDIFQNNQYLKFKIYTQKCYGDTIIWTVETNAPELDLPSVIDVLLEKRNLMMNRYTSTHGKSEMDILIPKFSGVLNRNMVLSHSQIFGDWVAIYQTYVKNKEEPWHIITTKNSIERQLITPEYSLRFVANSRCILGGSTYDAIKTEGFYDSMHNIIVSSANGITIAYIISLENNVLTLVIRCRQNINGELSTMDYNDLLLLKYKRISDLKKLLESS